MHRAGVASLPLLCRGLTAFRPFRCRRGRAVARSRGRALQTPNGSAYVVGDNGLRTALLEVGYTLTDTDPDYVVVGETNHYTFDMIEKAINLVYRYRGAKQTGSARRRSAPVPADASAGSVDVPPASWRRTAGPG